jgi:hypothetical protein
VRQRLGVPGMEVWPARRGLGCSVSPWIARTAALSQRVRSEQVPSNDPRLSAVGCVAGHVSKSALLGRHPPPTNPPLVSGPFYCTEPTKYKTGYVRLRHYGTLCVGLIRGKEITCARLWRCRSIRQRKTRACNQFGKNEKNGRRRARDRHPVHRGHRTDRHGLHRHVRNSGRGAGRLDAASVTRLHASAGIAPPAANAKAWCLQNHSLMAGAADPTQRGSVRRNGPFKS